MATDDKPVVKGILILLRSGFCEFNEKSLFCGWYDSPLTEKGQEQAKEAATYLRKRSYIPDVAYSSALTRTKDTLQILLEELEIPEIPVSATWRLNPKHYGALTSWNKTEMAGKYTEEQVLIWRRSLKVFPPPMPMDHEYYYEIVDDARYKKEEDPVPIVPNTENLDLVLRRIMPYYRSTILPDIESQKKVLIVGHGNSLRALMTVLEPGLTEKDMLSLVVPNGIPIAYEFDVEHNMAPIIVRRFLADESATQQRIQVSINQGKPP